jgi:magnesium-transporting ATPase (P-type)
VGILRYKENGKNNIDNINVDEIKEREWEIEEINASELVPGDIIEVRERERVGADCVLI